MDITTRGFEKASDKLTAEQLDKPVGEETKVETPANEVEAEPAVESVPEEAIKTEEPAEESKEEAVEEEEKVPKSRFLTMHQRAVEAERALRTFEAERATQPEKESTVSDDEDLKKFYIETFGDTELSQKLYKNELSRLASIEEKAAERAYERLSRREQDEQELIDQRVASFDSAFEELAIAEGKTDFSDDEQVAMLDIVEKYSPKDTDGKLLGDFLLPLDKAYEIYKLNQEPVVQAKKQERNAVAALQGARSEGSPTNSNDAEWRPFETGRWRNKVN